MKEKLELLCKTAVNGGKDEALQNSENVNMRKNAILQHFGSLTAKEDADGNIILYEGIVTITPPFLPSSCLSTNATALQRVKGILLEVIGQDNDH